jgi:hypothetical protein
MGNLLIQDLAQDRKVAGENRAPGGKIFERLQGAHPPGGVRAPARGGHLSLIGHEQNITRSQVQREI